MAPKGGMTQAQKLEKVLQYFYESRTCHTLKDLESAIPAATKINKMQVKDLIKELTDNNQVKVEKVGSGNWYWAWAGEEVTEKQNSIASLESGIAVLETSISTMQDRINELKANQAESHDNPQFETLLSRLPHLEQEVQTLAKEKNEWEHTVNGGLEVKKQELKALNMDVVLVTDNIDALESWLQKQFQGDRSMMESIRRLCYGDDFVEEGSLEEVNGA